MIIIALISVTPLLKQELSTLNDKNYSKLKNLDKIDQRMIYLS